MSSVLGRRVNEQSDAAVTTPEGLYPHQPHQKQ